MPCFWTRSQTTAVHPCRCCDSADHSLHGFVANADGQRALYLVEHFDLGPDGADVRAELELAIGLPDGTSVGFRVESVEGRVRTWLVAPGPGRAHVASLLGRWRSREETNDMLAELRDLVELVIEGDDRLAAIVETCPPTVRTGHAPPASQERLVAPTQIAV